MAESCSSFLVFKAYITYVAEEGRGTQHTFLHLEVDSYIWIDSFFYIHMISGNY